MDVVKKDGRFAHIAKDPRFHKMRKQNKKVKIDKRFRGMMTDNNFKLKYKVDPRGRPINATTNENLRRFYDLSDSDSMGDSDSETEEQSGEKETEKSKALRKNDQKDDSQDVRKPEKTAKGKPLSDNIGIKECSERGGEDEEDKVSEGTDQSESASSDEEEGEDEKSEQNKQSEEDSDASSVDYARGEGDLSSSSDDDEEEDDDQELEQEDDNKEEFDHGWGELDKTAVQDVEPTRRLAVCNMDWDRIKAADLMVLLSSFLPPGGVLRSVTIYPSEYGQACMAEEDVQGPKGLHENKKNTDDKSEQGSEYHREKLRRYQLQRLRYYYAVVECDSVGTGAHIYEQCDGMEYESSASRLDLRFIPEDMEFDQEPSSVATDVPDATTYKPSMFVTDALQQSKVNLTWDETDHDRTAVTMRKFTKDEIEELDVKDYLASDSEDEDRGQDMYGGLEEPDFGTAEGDGKGEDEQTQIDKYRALLQGLKDSEQDKEQHDQDMEITWEPGLKESTEELVKSKSKKTSMTPWEDFLEKKKEKKKKRKGENVKKEEEPVAAFSDDELPAGVDGTDSFFQDSLNDKAAVPAKGKKDKKKSKKKKQPTEEEEKDAGELSLLMMEEDASRDQHHGPHFSLTAIQAAEKAHGKRKRKKQLRKKGVEAAAALQDDFKVNVSDDRFRELYDNPLFNMDPSAPEFKKTRAIDTLIEEKLKRRQEKRRKPSEGKTDSKRARQEGSEEGDAAQSLASLVRSVKAKTQVLQHRKANKRK